MGQVLMRVKGFDGEVELQTDRVIIHRPGVFNMFKYGPNAKREIPLSAISEIGFVKPLLLGMGEIEFVRSGRSSDERKQANNVVKFKKNKLVEFERLKEKVFELIQQYSKQR